MYMRHEHCTRVEVYLRHELCVCVTNTVHVHVSNYICMTNYIYESRTLYLCQTIFTSQIYELYLRHELCIWATNHIHESQIMYMSHELCTWNAGSTYIFLSWGRGFCSQYVTDHIYEPRTMYMSHEICIGITNYAYYSRMRRKLCIWNGSSLSRSFPRPTESWWKQIHVGVIRSQL